MILKVLSKGQSAGGRKGAQRQPLRSRRLPVGWGLPREKVGVKKFDVSLEVQRKRTWRDVLEYLAGYLKNSGSTQKIENEKYVNNYQCSTEGQKFHQHLAPVLVLISWNSLAFSRKVITSTDFTGIAPRHASTSSAKKSVSHKSVSGA